MGDARTVPVRLVDVKDAPRRGGGPSSRCRGPAPVRPGACGSAVCRQKRCTNGASMASTTCWMPSTEVAMEVLRPRRLTHEHRMAGIAPASYEEAVHEAGLVWCELALPQLVEVAVLE